MPSTAATIHEVAQTLLTTSEAILATTVGGPVELAYLSPGLPSIDYQCDQLAVWASAIADEATQPLSPIPATGQRRRIAWQNIVTLTTLAVRCIKVGGTTKTGYTPPSQAALTLDAEKVMEDGWALWNGISTAIRDDALFGGPCEDIKFLSQTPLTPQGGVAGWTLTLSFKLAGYH